ncbi:MAG: hypothetical protein M1829_001259 [Trizodia sp. TS-e1964]|nr:MAG: hypothetical protein M1829_001259 [Trizodia sp. TS-e1964]
MQKIATLACKSWKNTRMESSPWRHRGCQTPPKVNFRVRGGFATHTWYVTRINLIFSRTPDGKHFNGLVHLDPLDTVLRDAIRILAMQNEPSISFNDPKSLGVGLIFSEMIYLINLNWGAFLKEAEEYIALLGEYCVHSELSAADQLMYTRELHQVIAQWAEARRRIVSAGNVARQMIEHPFFVALDIRTGIEGHISRNAASLADFVVRIDEIKAQTQVLISLIFNIATLQDTRAAVEEARAANQLAQSIRRVTFLTFVYLPLSLATGILGMNVVEISGAQDSTAIWVYFLISVLLLGLTMGIWWSWSKVEASPKRRKGRVAMLPFEHPLQSIV